MGVAEDAEGLKGVFLRKNVIEVAGRALKTNITALAPRVLPWSQLVRQLASSTPGFLACQAVSRAEDANKLLIVLFKSKLGLLGMRCSFWKLTQKVLAWQWPPSSFGPSDK